MRYALPRALSVAVVLGTLAVSVALLPSLPAEMATHWNAAGEVDDTMGKTAGALFVPGTMLFVLAMLHVAPAIDPKRGNIEGFRGAYEWFVAGTMAFLAYVHGLTLLWNLGYEIPIAVGVVPAVAALFVAAGFLIERAGQNWTVGIRTPWTLSDEDVWRETHRRGGLAFKLAGVVALVGLAFPEQAVWFVVVPLLLAGAYAVGYSFVAYRRRNSGS